MPVCKILHHGIVLLTKGRNDIFKDIYKERATVKLLSFFTNYTTAYLITEMALLKVCVLDSIRSI